MWRLLIVINWKQIVHLVGPIILIYYDARLRNLLWQSLRSQTNGMKNIA
jgi:hypothetical protein